MSIFFKKQNNLLVLLSFTAMLSGILNGMEAPSDNLDNNSNSDYEALYFDLANQQLNEYEGIKEWLNEFYINALTESQSFDTLDQKLQQIKQAAIVEYGSNNSYFKTHFLKIVNNIGDLKEKLNEFNALTAVHVKSKDFKIINSMLQQLKDVVFKEIEKCLSSKNLTSELQTIKLKELRILFNEEKAALKKFDTQYKINQIKILAAIIAAKVVTIYLSVHNTMPVMAFLITMCVIVIAIPTLIYFYCTIADGLYSTNVDNGNLLEPLDKIIEHISVQIMKLGLEEKKNL